MGIVQTPRAKLRAPDDTELVRNGASAMRDLASDADGAFVMHDESLPVTLRAKTQVIGADLVSDGAKVIIHTNGRGGAALISDTNEQLRVGRVDGTGWARLAVANATVGNEAATLSQTIPAASSREFKTNIEPATDSAAFDVIQPVLFDYREDTEWANGPDKAVRHVGFIAEDVEAAGLGVRKTDDGTVIGLRESELIAVLWLRVQELETRIATLEAKS